MADPKHEVLVVTDLDGTLWDEHQWMHADTTAAIAELERRNVDLLVATGRRLGSAKSGFELNDLWKPSIMLNGAIGVNFPSGDTFHATCFSAAVGQAVYEAFQRYEHEPVLYGADGLVYGAAHATTGAIHRRSLAAELIETDPLDALAAESVLGLSILGVEPDGLEGLGEELRALDMLVDKYQDPLYGQWSIMAQPPGVSKQTGIDAYIALRYPEKQRPRVIALGDAGNDVEMIREADVGIAVEGGHESVTSIADRHIAPPSSGGWADVLEVVDELSFG